MQMKLGELSLGHVAQYNLTRCLAKRGGPIFRTIALWSIIPTWIKVNASVTITIETHPPFTLKEGTMVIGAIVFVVVLGTILFALLSFSGLLDSSD
jgi:hypothetical protein